MDVIRNIKVCVCGGGGLSFSGARDVDNWFPSVGNSFHMVHEMR